MRNELGQKVFINGVHLSGNRSVSAGNRYPTAMAECCSSRRGVYAVYVNDAIFKEIVVKEKTWQVKTLKYKTL